MDSLHQRERHKLFTSNREGILRKYANSIAHNMREKLNADDTLAEWNDKFQDNKLGSIIEKDLITCDKSLANFLEASMTVLTLALWYLISQK